MSAIGNVKCVKLLIDAGADYNLQDKEGESMPQCGPAGSCSAEGHKQRL